MCGFSGRATQILNHLGVPFKGVNVLDSDDLRQGIKNYTNWPTIPQLYVKGEFVGGSDIMMEMFQSGELKTLMTEKGLG
jgi:monothiol glutaredoxin